MHVSNSLCSLQGMGYPDGPDGEQTTPSQGLGVVTEVYNQNVGYRLFRECVQHIPTSVSLWLCCTVQIDYRSCIWAMHIVVGELGVIGNDVMKSVQLVRVFWFILLYSR